MEEKQANEVVATSVHPTEMHQGVDTSRERTVEPTTTLTDKLRSSFRYIGLTLGGFDIAQMPFRAGFNDQFETENTILGQEHVLLENVHTLNTFGAKLL